MYDAIKPVDALDDGKPFLMSFDLPVPTKCVLEKEEVGGLRTCFFKGGQWSHADFGGGTIVEQITKLERGKVLKMDVVSYSLIGRKWPGFKEAIYSFDKVGDSSCRPTRIRTYTAVGEGMAAGRHVSHVPAAIQPMERRFKTGHHTGRNATRQSALLFLKEVSKTQLGEGLCARRKVNFRNRRGFVLQPALGVKLCFFPFYVEDVLDGQTDLVLLL